MLLAQRSVLAEELGVLRAVREDLVVIRLCFLARLRRVLRRALLSLAQRRQLALEPRVLPLDLVLRRIGREADVVVKMR